MPSQTRPLIIDCDPGVDDCIALFIALASPELDVRAVTTVAGNVRLETCTRNALAALELAGRTDVPVFAGCGRPLQAEPVYADHIHGESGLGRAVLPEPARPAEAEHAVDFLIRTLREDRERPITLAITGPATNLATALQRAPDIVSGISEIVLMGGADREGGNITPHAEFNAYADPHAAEIVVQSGLNLTILSLDVTLQLRCTPPRMDVLDAANTPVTRAVSAMIGHVNAIYGNVYGSEGAALHDPCVILYLLRPDLFEAHPVRVDVQTGPDAWRGHTRVQEPAPGRTANALWVDRIDADAAFDLLMERVVTL